MRVSVEYFAAALLNRLLEEDVSVELHGRLMDWTAARLGRPIFTRVCELADQLAGEAPHPEPAHHG